MHENQLQTWKGKFKTIVFSTSTGLWNLATSLEACSVKVYCASWMYQFTIHRIWKGIIVLLLYCMSWVAAFFGKLISHIAFEIKIIQKFYGQTIKLRTIHTMNRQ